MLHVCRASVCRQMGSTAASIHCILRRFDFPVQKKDDTLQQQFSMMAGISVGATVKSKKLQQRNAILRSTGFIEGPASVNGVGGNALATSQLLLLCSLEDLY